MAVGAEMAASTAIPARAVFCTISKLARLVTTTKPLSAGTPSCATAPISLSSALWRPTSSRTVRSTPSRSAQPAAWTAPVARCRCWRAAIAAIARCSAPGANCVVTPCAPPSRASIRPVSRSNQARLSTPHRPQPVLPVRARRVSFRRAMAPGAISIASVMPCGPVSMAMSRISAAWRTMRSDSENPSAKSSRSCGEASITAWLMPL